MKHLLSLVLCLSLFALTGCSEDDDSSDSSTPLNENATAINKANTALGSISGLVSSSSFSTRAGTANSHCSGTGSPFDAGSGMSPSDAGYQGALGYCQATFNSLSPDTVRGSIYIAGGLSCEASRHGAFDGVSPGTPVSVTVDVTFDTTCWGSDEDIANLIESGMTSLPGVTFTVTDVSATTAYGYKIEYAAGSGAESISESLHVYSEGAVTAALSSEGWAFEMNSTDGTIRFESIDSSHSRRNRMLVEGTISSTGTYSAISSISGFQTQSGDLSTYNGDLNGLIGDYYDGGAGADRTDECFIQTVATPNCASFTALAGAGETAATNLNTGLAALDASLVAFTDSRLSFTTIDVTDVDLTD